MADDSASSRGMSRGGYGARGGGFGGNSGAQGRPERTMHTNTITPKYGWDQAQLSDFGISGGLMNAVRGIVAGNTYAGRTPQGFSNHNVRAGGSGPMSYGGGNQGLPSTINPLMQKLMGAGLYRGGTNQNKIAQAQSNPVPLPTQAPKPVQQGPSYTPFTMGSKYLSANAPGLAEYGVYSPFFQR